MSIRRVSVLVGVVASIVAGCTTVSAGVPAPASTGSGSATSDSPAPTSSSNEQELPYGGAPKVENPLDTTRFQENPCLALTEQQAESLGLPPSGAATEMPFGNACEWSRPHAIGQATIHFLDEHPYGLSAEYQAHEDGKTAFFEELPPIEGYPAIATDVHDGRPQGLCTVVVGVSDKVSFEVPVDLAQDSVGTVDPCDAAVDVAEMALQTMKQS